MRAALMVIDLRIGRDGTKFMPRRVAHHCLSSPDSRQTKMEKKGDPFAVEEHERRVHIADRGDVS